MGIVLHNPHRWPANEPESFSQSITLKWGGAAHWLECALLRAEWCRRPLQRPSIFAPILSGGGMGPGPDWPVLWGGRIKRLAGFSLRRRRARPRLDKRSRYYTIRPRLDWPSVGWRRRRPAVLLPNTPVSQQRVAGVKVKWLFPLLVCPTQAARAVSTPTIHFVRVD